MTEEEYPTYDLISEDDKKKFLILKGVPFFALSAAGIMASLYSFYAGSMVLFYLFIALSLAAVVSGFVPLLFWKEEEKRDYISSKLYRMNLAYQKQNGITYSPEELDQLRFANDPLFRQEVIAKVHKEEDAKYKKAVDSANSRLVKLKKEYDKRYWQISDARWEKLNPYIQVNRTEGKLIINGAECDFSKLRSARVVNQLGYRTESYEREYTEEHTKEHRDLSVGGAIAGGLVAGPIGAVAGAVLFSKNRTETVEETKTDVFHEQTPVCNHLGVKVNLNGFETEIVLISSEKEQKGMEYRRKLDEANKIAAALHTFAETPMPRNVPLVEQEPELVLLYDDIRAAKKALKRAKENKPTYAIPQRYLPDSGWKEEAEETEDEVIDLTSEEFTVFRSKKENEQRQSR